MMLQVSGINSFYGETQALFDVSLEIGAGEAVSLLGPNGAGKTTVLRSILGLTPARSGSIHFNGQDITRTQTHRIAQAGIGWVPDDRRIFPTLTVRKNLALGRKASPFRSWSLDECFGLFSALEYLMDRECENLSGGEMQMVAIARALLGSPGLILLDEPSQGLAPKLVQDVMAAVRKLRAEGVAVLIIEQNARSVLAATDRVYILRHGQIAYEGDPNALLEDSERRAALTGA